jgi:UDP-N-acetyl-D-mannosaminuronate dehydrogenase
MKVGILGLGEVGGALASLYESMKIHTIKKDIDDDDVKFKDISILNICIPYSKKFKNIVLCEILSCNPKLTIIHSTVPIGTTAQIKKVLTHHIVHSPVIGSHPFLVESLETFVKHIGSSDEKAIKLTEDHYNKLKIKYKSFDSYEATETAKLLCTTYYGLCIAWHDQMKSICDEYNIDFSIIKEWNQNYNEGYNKLGLSMYNRPILNPPKDKKIGGHCIISNAKLLESTNPTKLVKEILKYDSN